MRTHHLVFTALILGPLASCGGDPNVVIDNGEENGSNPLTDPVDVPIKGVSRELEATFNDGDLAFSTPLREGDGLGPLYTRSACDSCHESALRGPGLVQKMSLVEADGITPVGDQSKLEYGHTVHPLRTAGGTTAILPPDGVSIKVSTRIGPPVIGRGYLEAIDDRAIERVAAEQAKREDEVHGRINRVRYTSEPNQGTDFDFFEKGDLVIGRFGLKARIATLDDFSADALQFDMGITSPLRPTEFPNPDGLLDDDKPGVDVGYTAVNLRAMYIRLLAIPKRYGTPEGASLFDQAQCSACHVPSLKTRSDYPLRELAGIDAPVYSDMLLHDMGDELADGLPEAAEIDGEAGPRDWRTAPLIGLRFNRTLLHDGRATTVEKAIEMHQGPGSEANDSIDRFMSLSDEERDTLVKFVEGL